MKAKKRQRETRATTDAHHTSASQDTTGTKAI